MKEEDLLSSHTNTLLNKFKNNQECITTTQQLNFNHPVKELYGIQFTLIRANGNAADTVNRWSDSKVHPLLVRY